MSLFGQLKDMNEMRKQAKQMQDILAKETVEGTSHDNAFKVVIDGNQNVLRVEINDSIIGDKGALEKGAREAFAQSLDNLKKIMVTKLSGMMGA